MNTNVVIIGCGLNGLLLAKSLEAHDINTTIIEHGEINATINDNRCIALSHQAYQMLLYLNVFSNSIKNKHGVINDIYISCANSLVHYNNKEINKGKHPLGYTISYTVLKKMLLDSVLSSKKITILQKTTYTKIQINSSMAVISTSNNLTIRTPLIVCAEGKNSKLQNAVNIGSYIFDYRQLCITFHIVHTQPNNNMSFERFGSDMPFALLPTANKFESSLILLVPKNCNQDIANMNEQLTIELVNKIIPRPLGTALKSMKKNCFPLTLNIAKKYYKKRIVLAGDALHGIHPVTGQGFNIATQDTLSLVTILREALDNGIDIGSVEVLSKFYKNRRINNAAIIHYTDKMVRTFSGKKQKILLQQLVANSLNILNKSTDVKAKIVSIINAAY
ncbi:putative 2-octaprenyl-3-methyl-6-methoxy-1,4-benzoquinol hydroxylase [Candidatus Xenohaliotis californiensis]|uniref:2-octaprenyl-3-methyl-6-methoxy-1,4-benzoquinol hydroxylase n=1 Tax=Candidatus Xenohaliotis californiensis TaxID=84677 RepID=A0ABM9N704_9RICK|nr:putative 2-octaprenyl-3-methyl-6-methoxy-1,4-benzoquinol hydroxylase [Candidatus Xenohaliotis californiensis]